MASPCEHGSKSVKALDTTKQWRDVIALSDGYHGGEFVFVPAKSKCMHERQQTGGWCDAVESNGLSSRNVVDQDDTQMLWKDRDVSSGVSQQVGQPDPPLGTLRVTLDADKGSGNRSENQAGGRTVVKTLRAQLESHGWESIGWRCAHGDSGGLASRTPSNCPCLATALFHRSGSRTDTVFEDWLLTRDRCVSSLYLSLASGTHRVNVRAALCLDVFLTHEV